MPSWGSFLCWEPLPTALHRKLRHCLFGGIIVLIIVGAATTLQRLPRLATWAIERSLPGMSAELKGLTFHWPDRLEADGLVLKSRKTGRRVFSLRGGDVTFDFQGLFQHRIAGVALREPEIFLTPEFFELLGSGTSAEPPTRNDSWKIGRVTCPYGTFHVLGLGPEGMEVTSLFTFDFGDFPDGGPFTLTLWDLVVMAGNVRVLNIDLAEVVMLPKELKESARIQTTKIKGGKLILGEALLGLFQGTSGTSSGLTLGTLVIENLDVQLDDTRELGADINFGINTSLTNIPLSQAASALGEEMQRIEIADIEILSPYDPLAKVLTIRNLILDFTLAGILRQEIASVTVESPAIYVSQDLFWYMDEAQKRFASEGEDSKDGGWTVQRFQLTGGKLVIGSGGRASYGLPLTFRTSAENVSLGNLASFRAQAVMEIPAQKYAFDDYQLEFTTQGGELRFAYPPEKEENNLVGTLKIEDLRWRQFRGSDSWVSVTFDHEGINGEFGGVTYTGYSSGGFSFFFNAESPWIGWLSGKGIDLKKLTDILAPENFRMTGPLNFRLQVDAERQDIQRVKGEFHTTRPGTMTISKLDEMLARIPDTWPGLKRDAMRIGLETLRDFDYATCKGKVWFVESQGVLDLALQGPTGSRNFQIVLHSDDSPDGRWKMKSP